MIYVIIPVYNRVKFTLDCLACLAGQSYRNFQTIVIDDGSTDGTFETIRADYPDVTIIQGDGNLWWTKAINMGVQYVLNDSESVDDLILTLNDDLEIKPNYLETLTNLYSKLKPVNSYPLIGSVVVDIKNPNYLEYAGAICNYYTGKGRRLSRLYMNDYQQLKQKVDYLETDDLSGRGTLIPVKVFKKIGLYDSHNFPHYQADVEFSVRAKKSGFPLYVSVDSIIYNHMEATRNKKVGVIDFIKSFFSFKSPNYLKARYVFAMRHSPLKSIYFIIDLLRITGSFVLKK